MATQEDPIYEVVAKWLRDQGHLTELDHFAPDLTAVLFQTRGMRFVVVTYQRDPNFLHLVHDVGLPYDVDEAGCLDLARAVQNAHKVVKLSVRWAENIVRFEAEQLLAEPSSLGAIFWRTISLLEGAALEIFRLACDRAVAAPAAAFIAGLERDIQPMERPRGT